MNIMNKVSCLACCSQNRQDSYLWVLQKKKTMKLRRGRADGEEQETPHGTHSEEMLQAQVTGEPGGGTPHRSVRQKPWNVCQKSLLTCVPGGYTRGDEQENNGKQMFSLRFFKCVYLWGKELHTHVELQGNSGESALSSNEVSPRDPIQVRLEGKHLYLLSHLGNTGNLFTCEEARGRCQGSSSIPLHIIF